MRRLLPLVALALVAAGSALSATATSAGSKPTLRFASATSVSNLNPAIDIDSYVLALAYAALLHINPDGSFAPALATSWHYVGTGNKTFELTLRKDAHFSDGTPVNAQAVKKWMTYFSTEKGAFAKNIPFKTIQTVGQWKVVLHLSRAEPNMPLLLSEPIESGFIGSPKALSNPDQLKTHTDGAGPYMVDPSQTVPGDHYTFVPNPHYYDPSAIKFSKVTYRTITQPTTLLAAVQTGQLDTGFGDLSTVKQAEAAGLNIVTAPLGWVGLLLLDRGPTTQDGQPNPLSKLAVRQALNYAVDRNEVNDLIYQGKSEPMWATWTQSNALFNPKLKNYYKYNPTKAKQLIKESGVGKVSFDFYAGPLPENQRMAEILKEQWAKVGIQANLVNFTNIVQEFFQDNKAPAGVIPLMRSGLDKVTRNLVPGSVGDKCNYDDPKLNALVAKVRELGADTKEFQKAWWDLDAYIVKNALHVYVVWAPNITAYNTGRVGNMTYRPDVFGQPRVDVFKVYIRKGK